MGRVGNPLRWWCDRRRTNIQDANAMPNVSGENPGEIGVDRGSVCHVRNGMNRGCQNGKPGHSAGAVNAWARLSNASNPGKNRLKSPPPT